MVFAEGNAELTPARLIGQYDPAQVLADADTSRPASPTARCCGPCASGALLYLEEFNRVPEETLNVLITVLAEAEIAVPRLGMVRAEPGFRLVAAMNPFDAIGTAPGQPGHRRPDLPGRARLSGRRRRTSDHHRRDRRERPAGATSRWPLTRATREHRDVRMGASVRGAIDLVLLLTGLARLRGEDSLTARADRSATAAHAALSGRIRLADGCDRTPEIGDLDELARRRSGPAPGRPEKTARRPGATGQAGRRQAAGPASGSLRCAGTGPTAAPGEPSAGPSWPPGIPRWPPSHPSRRPAGRGRVRPAAGGRPGCRAGPAGRPGPGHRPAAARGRPAAGRAAVLPAGPGGPAARPGHPAAGGGPRATGTSTWTGPWTAGPGTWPPPPADLVTQSWFAPRRALCLLVDRSGSMSGLAVAIAAVAAASVVLASDGRLSPGIVAFSGQVRVLQPQGTRRPASGLVGELVALRGHGLTDLAAALRTAAAQLATAPASERVAVLLSDCLPTAGPDPALALGGISTLHVLCPRPTAAAERAATALARRGGGLCQPVRGLDDVAPALTRVLSWSEP